MNDSVTDSGPFEEQRHIFKLLSQETRHLIIQFILGHPEHLMSLDELAYAIPKSKAAINDQVDTLVEAGILSLYTYEDSENKRDLPSKFYGPTERGIDILYEYKYLRGVPVARALYDNARKSEKIERHENAPRPELPEKVRKAFSSDEQTTESQLDSFIRDRNERLPTIDEQVELANSFAEEGIGPEHDGLSERDVQKKLTTDSEYTVRNLLMHLVEVGLVEEIQPSGPEMLLVSERINEVINGRVEEEVERNLEELINHMDGQLRVSSTEDLQSGSPPAAADGAGETIRSLLAKEFDVLPEDVESHLRAGDKLTKLNAAVEAIENSEWTTKGDEYGKINYVRPPNRYRLTEKAVELAET
ncbi:helix-turn-helix domain-containing protein [Halorussus ruber]|uniref:hypothetical protein n=1 Tax=Halorussus ruber TaxID=1126238 RepID=UPI001092AF51|nr:hypothetical protein [Halorussus ruber]